MLVEIIFGIVCVSFVLLLFLIIIFDKKHKEIKKTIEEKIINISKLEESILLSELKIKNIEKIGKKLDKSKSGKKSNYEELEKELYDLSILEGLLRINKHNPHFVEWWLS